MAQAVAAQILARTSALTGDPTLLDVAARAYAAVPAGLVLQLPSGPWIRHYSFARVVVLNSQLQSTVSILEYAQARGDTDAAALGQRLAATTKALLPRFDTGAWTLYSLGSSEESLEYHKYVVELPAALPPPDERLLLGDHRLALPELTTPPQVTPGAAPGKLYPRPADGYRDYARMRFSLSKASTVTLTVAGRPAIYAGPLLSSGGEKLTRLRCVPARHYGPRCTRCLAGNVTDVSLTALRSVACRVRPPSRPPYSSVPS